MFGAYNCQQLVSEKTSIIAPDTMNIISVFSTAILYIAWFFYILSLVDLVASLFLSVTNSLSLNPKSGKLNTFTIKFWKK
jgi:hypothetical protein